MLKVSPVKRHIERIKNKRTGSHKQKYEKEKKKRELLCFLQIPSFPKRESTRTEITSSFIIHIE